VLLPGDIPFEIEDEEMEEAEEMEEGEDAEPRVASSELDFATLKAKFDSYGVAVRAGSLTPQKSDEEAFRREAGLPVIGPEVAGAWEFDGGYRRPITLRSGSESEAEIEIIESETGSTEAEESSAT
jgi:hypothetical protein